MATEASRATGLREQPRFAPPTGSLAATAAARPISVKPAQAFPAAWAEVWQASGGVISQTGADLMISCPMGITKVTAPGNPALHLFFQNPAEQQGALNALHALLRRAGASALRSFLLSDTDPLEADWDIICTAYRNGADLADGEVDAAHYRILHARPSTTRGAIIQMLVSLLHEHGVIPGDIDFEAAVVSEDYASLSLWEETGRLDWSVRFSVRALCTLAAMEANNG